MKLKDKHCVPCEGIGRALDKNAAEELLTGLTGWQINESSTTISRILLMKNFTTAVELINRITKIAEAEDHHPDVHLTSYRNLRIDLSTHALKGLTENDFIVAAKINDLPMELKD